MTNYNKKHDEIFPDESKDTGLQHHLRNVWHDDFSEQEFIDEMEAYITSLIKELVAEAKPEKRELIEPVTGEPVSSGDKVTVDVEADPRGSLIFVQNNGYNMALNQFEQNLLKELEEVE